MYFLAIDTSSKFLCVALIKDGQVLAQYNKVHDRQHSVLLLSKIEKVLGVCKLSLGDIDCLAVDIGPGSFTGLRIGIATVKGLSFALNKPVLGLCSLDLISVSQQQEEADIICPLIDAKRQQVYSAVYKCSRGTIKRKGEYFLGTVDDLLKTLKGKVVFCGDALSLYRDKIKKHRDIQPVWAKQKCWYPNALSFARLCYGMSGRKDFKSADQVTPLYMYQNTCTVRREVKKQTLK